MSPQLQTHNFDMNFDLKAVWLLHYVRAEDDCRVSSIPFSSREGMEKRIKEILLKNISSFDPNYKLALLQAITDGKEFDLIASLFEDAKKNNQNNLPFDLYWDDAPTVVM